MTEHYAKLTIDDVVKVAAQFAMKSVSSIETGHEPKRGDANE